MLLRFFANNGSQLTVINGTVATGYTIMSDIDWGQVNWQHAASGKRGTQGARPAIGEPDNRFPSIPIRIGPTGTVDSCNVKAALLCEIVDDIRRFGGQICWQGTGQATRQWLEVMQAGITRQSWGERGAVTDRASCTVLAECAPYFLGDPMDTFDGFDSDSLSDYTNDSSSGTLSIAGGVAIPSSTGIKRYRHTAKGYLLSDVQVTLEFVTGSGPGAGVWGVGKMDSGGVDTGIVAEIVGAGTNLLRVGKYVAGSFTSLASTALTPTSFTQLWVRFRSEGNVIFGEAFGVPPTEASTPAVSVSYAMTPAEAGRFAQGHAAMRITPGTTGETYRSFTVEPFTYRLVNAPEQIRMTGTVPGDVAALADISVTPAGGSVTPIWGMVGWLERPLTSNLCWNGDAEDATIAAGGWVSTAVSGVMGAATSVARYVSGTEAKYGGCSLRIVTPATTDTGASFFISRRFKKGRTYVAMCWADSPSQTTSARIKLGVSGDLATGTAAALASGTATAYKVYSAVWTPTADRDGAYVAFGVNAATATTLQIDGVIVCEVPTITLSAAQASTSSTAFSVYNTPSEVPGLLADGTLGAPFLAMIDQELVRVTAIAAGGAWAADRGAEGSTAATHSADALVAILPPLRPHFEGKGAQAPFGVIEGDSYVANLSDDGAGAFSVAADANARGATVLRWTPGTSGAQLASIVYFIDPNTLVPDDYTLGEIDVEVMLRHAWTTSLTNVRVTLSAQPEGGATFGQQRFTREYGNIGKTPWPAGAKVMRPSRLGTIPMRVDRANPQRWRLVLTLACTGGASPTWDIDHMLFAATRARLASPTGEPNDTASASGAFPPFVPYNASWTTTSAMRKTLLSDMGALIAAPGGIGFPDAGLGDVIEIPDGDCDLIVKVAPIVPDDPTLDSTVETLATITTSAHAAITPRYTMARSS